MNYFMEQQLQFALWHFFISVLNRGGGGHLKNQLIIIKNSASAQIFHLTTKILPIKLESILGLL